MFEQLNGSFNQEDKKTFTNQLVTKVKIPEKEDLDNKQSFKSESPIARLKTREDEFCTGSSDIESAEQSFERSNQKSASSEIWNDTPRTEKSVESKASSRKSKVIMHHFRGKKYFIVEFGGISGRPEPIERCQCCILSRRFFNGVAWRVYLPCTNKGFGIF